MTAIAVAIVAAALVFAGAGLVAFRMWLAYRAGQDDPFGGGGRPRRARGAAAEPADDNEDGAGEEPEDESLQAVLEGLRMGVGGGAANHDAMMLDAWRQEMREDGYTEDEIEEMLDSRAPILLF